MRGYGHKNWIQIEDLHKGMTYCVANVMIVIHNWMSGTASGETVRHLLTVCRLGVSTEMTPLKIVCGNECMAANSHIMDITTTSLEQMPAPLRLRCFVFGLIYRSPPIDSDDQHGEGRHIHTTGLNEWHQNAEQLPEIHIRCQYIDDSERDVEYSHQNVRKGEICDQNVG